MSPEEWCGVLGEPWKSGTVYANLGTSFIKMYYREKRIDLLSAPSPLGRDFNDVEPFVGE